MGSEMCIRDSAKPGQLNLDYHGLRCIAKIVDRQGCIKLGDTCPEGQIDDTKQRRFTDIIGANQDEMRADIDLEILEAPIVFDLQP